MTRAARKILPHPVLSAILALVWILLQPEFSAGMAVVGLILGIVIPVFTAPWWPDSPRRIAVGPLLAYVALVVWDIALANVQVAWIVLTKPNAKLRPAWIVIPLDLRHPEAITVLAGTITLTPGTVSADLSESGHYLLVHALDTGDPDAVRDDIKHRYERRLQRIFA